MDNGVALRRSRRDIYNILSVLDEIRQWAVHDVKENEDTGKKGRAFLYKLDTALPDDVKITLNNLYQQKIDSFKNFAEHTSKTNFTLLFNALEPEDDYDRKWIAKEFYRFAVLKNYKNCGFSIKTLREKIIEKCFPEVSAEDYDSVRSKLYMIFDFLLVYYFSGDEDAADTLVNELRTNIKNNAKDIIYEAEAVRIWNDEGNSISKGFRRTATTLYQIAKESVSADSLKLSTSDERLLKSSIDEIALNGEATYFTKVIYLITLFLDGKEINDLLTTLTSKLDNIASLLRFAYSQNIPMEFEEDYAFFNKGSFLMKRPSIIGNFRITGKNDELVFPLLDELRNLNSFARMTSGVELTKEDMFMDAAHLLGWNSAESELKTFMSGTVLDPNSKNKGLRNFLVNNVVSSWRFKYVAKYIDPGKARLIVKNKAVVKYVLGQIPDTQIDRYCRSCAGPISGTRAEKLDFLTHELMNVSLNGFENVNQRANASKDAGKQRMQTVVTLYLNVIYQVVKNLVNINSRYVMAFHAVERDGKLLNINIRHEKHNYLELSKAHNDNQNKKIEAWQSELKEQGLMMKRKEFLHKRRRYQQYQTNYDNADEVMIGEFRNSVAHLNAVRNANKYIGNVKHVESYFALYHYLMQSSILDSFNFAKYKNWVKQAANGSWVYTTKNGDHLKINLKSIEYLDNVEKYSSYSKDFVRALCAPFIYNHARFDTLTTDGLFDRNRPKETIQSAE